jgi:hypothetical protein
MVETTHPNHSKTTSLLGTPRLGVAFLAIRAMALLVHIDASGEAAVPLREGTDIGIP